MDWQTFLNEYWHIYLVTITLIVAAWIDGKQLRVPNWITFPMVATGFVYNMTKFGFLEGIQIAFVGMCVGLLTLLLLHAGGGMGAGDVKLMAGVGAWLGWNVTLWAFVYTVIVGAVLAIIMVLWSGEWRKHYQQLLVIASEWMTVRSIQDLKKISEIAAERKPTMRLLPYGIPICIGSIAYFFMEGMLF